MKKEKKHTLKIYNNINSSYFILNKKRYNLNKLYYDRNNNILYLDVTNCTSHYLKNINILYDVDNKIECIEVYSIID